MFTRPIASTSKTAVASGIVAQLRRVAGKAENVLEPDRGGAQQVGLDAQNIAVAAGIVQQGLDAGLLLDLDAEALRAHPRRGARRVGNIDHMDAGSASSLAPSSSLPQAIPLGGTISTMVTNLACGDPRAQPGARRQGRGRISVPRAPR